MRKFKKQKKNTGDKEGFNRFVRRQKTKKGKKGLAGWD
jgi:hypothetical protein